MEWSGEGYDRWQNPAIRPYSQGRKPGLSILFLRCNLDAAKETCNQDICLSIYAKKYPFNANLVQLSGVLFWRGPFPWGEEKQPSPLL